MSSDRRAEWRSWYFYDWANSAYVTTVGTVLFSPYLISVAERSSCGRVGTDEDPCTTDLTVLGLHVSPGSLVFYVVTLATVVSALVLPVVGALADRSPRKRVIMASFAWLGAGFACAMVLVTGTDWRAWARPLLLANICLGSSLVIYDSILCRTSPVLTNGDEVSSRGWALGYLGGGLLLAINLVVVTMHSSLGSTRLWRYVCACSAPACGGPASPSSRFAGSGTGRRSTGSESLAGCCARASASSGRRFGACGRTR